MESWTKTTGPVGDIRLMKSSRGSDGENPEGGASLGGSSGEFSEIESESVFPTRVQVTYSVKASGYQEDRNEPDASVTFETPTGTSQLDVDDGWTKTFTFDAGAFVYLSVQNNTEGYVICQIESDGRTVSKNRSEGKSKIATCDGSS